MTLFFGMQRLNKVDDWKPIVGDKNWVPSHSAFELAQHWHRAASFPSNVQAVIGGSSESVLLGLHPEYGVVEKPVFLDSFVGPSWTDIMLYARNGRGDSVVIAVEGKAHEPFADPVRHWVRDLSAGRTIESEDQPKPSRVRRLEYLSRVLRIQISSDSPLRYQLLHRTASAVQEAQLHGSVAAMVLVHSFAAESSNSVDFTNFLEKLSVLPGDGLVGPIQLGIGSNMATYFAWVSDNPWHPGA